MGAEPVVYNSFCLSKFIRVTLFSVSLENYYISDQFIPGSATPIQGRSVAQGLWFGGFVFEPCSLGHGAVLLSRLLSKKEMTAF